MSILVVEDELKITYFIKKGLEIENFMVDVANDGKLGFEMAKKNNYDLIILDIMLPGMNGLEICKTLRKEKIKTPIIFLTALDTSEDMVKGLEAGADDYLVKPFSFKELVARINTLLRNNGTDTETAKIQEKEEYFGNLIKNSCDDIIITDISGKISFANDAFLKRPDFSGKKY